MPRTCYAFRMRSFHRIALILAVLLGLGAAGPQAAGLRVHGGFSYGSLGMAAYRFE